MAKKNIIYSGPRTYEAGDPIDISIPLDFSGTQPNAFGVESAASVACEYGSLIGDTRRGGSCNFERVTLIPHCNGTHTECVGHIIDERISVLDCLKDVFIHAILISVEPEELEGGDLLITKALLEKGLATPWEMAGDEAEAAGGMPAVQSRGLIVRTLPNDKRKLARVYGESNIPSYFAADAMHFIGECGFKHLLVDLPSIDRLFDEGKLVNHRIFWNVEMESREIHENTRIENTITELIYVPNSVEDGEYLLNLQIAPFKSDAAPSRPVLVKKLSSSYEHR